MSTGCLQVLQAINDLSTVESLHTSVNVGWQTKQLGLVRFGQLPNGIDIVTWIVALRSLHHIGQSCLTPESLVGEHLHHVGLEHSHVILVIDSASIDGILQDSIDLWPI